MGASNAKVLFRSNSEQRDSSCQSYNHHLFASLNLSSSTLLFLYHRLHHPELEPDPAACFVTTLNSLVMGLYRPLVVTALLEGCPLLELFRPTVMRMNLIATSQEDPRIMYIVHADEILVFRFSTLTPSGPPVLTTQIKDPRYIDDSDSGGTINVIKVGYLGTEEVLVTADESGKVCVWFTMNLQRDPLLLSVTQSAWGIAIHSEQRLIAISSNAHTATIFHCGTDSRLSQRTLFKDPEPSPSGLSSSSSSSYYTSGTRRSTLGQTASRHSSEDSMSTPLVDQASQQILIGHDHNIPTVAFSPCGQFVATASIDRTCRTWRLSDGKQIQQKSLAHLWGWGVAFVAPDAWTTVSRSEYKHISKDHLRPGKAPGLHVRDSPFLTIAPPLRRFMSPRDHRLIRTRWYAGPLHNTSCDEQESDEEGNTAEGGWRYGMMDNGRGEDNDDLDDRDAALFGMDDDEGEDELEDTNSGGSSNFDSEDEETEDPSSREQPRAASTGNIVRHAHPIRISRSTQDPEVSADTGNDGDNEEAGMDTEDGGGTTTEDGAVAARSAFARNVKNERRLSSATITRARSSSPNQYVESSSEHELPSTSVFPSSRIAKPESATDTEASDAGQSNLRRKKAQEEAGFNHDPSKVVYWAPTKDMLLHEQAQEQDAGGPGSSTLSSLSTPSQPQYPSELLLCATARNIYVLSQHPEDLEAADGTEASSASNNDRHGDNTLDNDSDDDDNLQEDQWHDAVSSEYEDDDDEYPLGPQYHNFTTDSESDDPDDGEMDEDDMMDDTLQDHQHSSRTTPRTSSSARGNTAVSLLHTISVARAAAARADGRGYRLLEQFDRLFVMIPVPELSVLIAASQKGAVTVFRLLRVVDDPSPAQPMVPSPPPKVATFAEAVRQGLPKDEVNTSKDNEKEGDLSSTVTIHGAKYVLFPEMYLPRQEPPLYPLIGVTVVPLQRTNSGSSRSYAAAAADTTTLPDGAAEEKEEEEEEATTTSSTVPSAAPSASFILHLAYMDAQLFSYEIRLRNDKDDPVNLSNIFV
ncbi:MAG: hypothetical protein J3Q66DRAFT_352828 [Benniella sp.]|nr:MAG: hypothetical protein J3Q66DRAFT_352828 [Benniella sp.]